MKDGLNLTKYQFIQQYNQNALIPSSSSTKTNNTTIIPRILHTNLIIHDSYKTLHKNDINAYDLGNQINLTRVNNIIKQLSHLFVEAIIKSSNDEWIYITQFEVYIHDIHKRIDDCATNQIPKNVTFPKVFVQKKTEFRNQWLEVSIIWDRIELLITGGIYGYQMKSSNKHDALHAFLGPSLPISSIETNGTWEILVSESYIKNDIIQETRMIRNFTKNSSNYKWCIKSARYCRKGFTTANALDLYQYNIKHYCRAASFILYLKVQGILFQKNKIQQIRVFLEEAGMSADLDIKKNSGTKKIYNALKRKSSTLSRSKEFVISCYCKIADGNELIAEDYINLYKLLIYPKLKSLNSRSINNKQYL